MHEGSMLRRCILLHADTAMLLAARVEGGLGACLARRGAAKACT